MSSNPSSRRTSILLAAAIAIALAAWILSGLGNDQTEDNTRLATGSAATGGAATGNANAMRVPVRRSQARSIARQITVSARTEPDRAIELKAETEGRVIAIGAERGSFVRTGQAIVEIDMRDRAARLAETEALIRQRELEYEAAIRLRDDQFMSAAELAGSEAQMIAARSARERITLDIERTTIAAPFDAVVFDRLVEIGDYLGIGDPVAQIVDADPLLVVGNINEKDIGSLAVGGPGTVRILNGAAIEGSVRYLAPVADESTRSFRIEVAVPNPDRKLRAGTSAVLVLGAEEISVHVLSAALLSLGDDGAVGIKTVDDSNRVHFMPVAIAGRTPDGLQVTGLPQQVRIITDGQGFVVDGQTVAPVEEPPALTQAQNERPD